MQEILDMEKATASSGIQVFALLEEAGVPGGNKCIKQKGLKMESN